MKSRIHHGCPCIVIVDNAHLLVCIFILVAIMSGARNCRDSIRCERLYSKMKIIFPHHKNELISASILLSNMYASLGNTDQVALIRSDRIKDHGNKVTPGMSWTEKNGEIVVRYCHVLRVSEYNRCVRGYMKIFIRIKIQRKYQCN